MENPNMLPPPKTDGSLPQHHLTARAHTTGLLSMPYDVLLAVFSYIPPGESTSYCTTCRTFYDLALPHILSLAGGVKLRSDRRFLRFYAFIMMDPANRIPLLRTFHFPCCDSNTTIQAEDPSNVTLPVVTPQAALVDLLMQAHNLRVLNIDNLDKYFDNASDVNNRLRDALTALPSLEEIYAIVGERSFDVVRHMRSPLCKIVLTSPVYHTGRYCSAFVLLKNFQSTLCEVHMRGYAFENADLEPTMCWPRVRRLYLSSIKADISRTTALGPLLSQAFPNVRSIVIPSFKYPMTSRPHQPEDVSAAGAVGWPDLNHLEGNDLPLSTLGQLCPVHTARIIGTDRLVALLRSCTPQVFITHLNLNRDVRIYQDIAKVAPAIRFLDLTLRVPRHLPPRVVANDTENVLEDWSMLVPPILGRIPLYAMQLHVHYPSGISADSIDGLDTLEATTRSRLAEAIPSLLYVCLEAGTAARLRAEDALPQWWHVSRDADSGRCELEMLSQETGLAVQHALLRVDHVPESWTHEIEAAYQSHRQD